MRPPRVFFTLSNGKHEALFWAKRKIWTKEKIQNDISRLTISRSQCFVPPTIKQTNISDINRISKHYLQRKVKLLPISLGNTKQLTSDNCSLIRHLFYVQKVKS